MAVTTKPSSHYAVCVPLVTWELPEALLSHRWWDREMLPSCLKQEPSFDLVYVLPGERCEKFEETLEKSFREHRLMRFFSAVRFVYAGLEPEKNFYIRESEIRPVNEFGLKSGPNYQFFCTFEEVGVNYRAILLMEVDCVAIRSGWLDQAVDELARESEAWVIGSRYHGPRLPHPLTDHLNGNAIYRSGSRCFQDFFSKIWRPATENITRFQQPNMAFDCALVQYFSNNDSEVYDNHFVTSHFCANMAPALNYPRKKHSIQELSEAMTETFIIHASWLLDEVKAKLDFDESECEREFTPRKIDRSESGWVWIKKFRARGSARFDGGEFSIENSVGVISWRLGCEVLPTIEINVENGELTVRIEQLNKSYLATSKSRIRRLNESNIVGKNMIINCLLFLRSSNLEGKYERLLTKLACSQLPEKKRLMRCFKASFCLITFPFKKINQMRLLGCFFGRDQPREYSFQKGRHLIDLADLKKESSLADCDLSLSFLNRQCESVHGRMDFGSS